MGTKRTECKHGKESKCHCLEKVKPHLGLISTQARSNPFLPEIADFVGTPTHNHVIALPDSCMSKKSPVPWDKDFEPFTPEEVLAQEMDVEYGEAEL